MFVGHHDDPSPLKSCHHREVSEDTNLLLSEYRCVVPFHINLDPLDISMAILDLYNEDAELERRLSLSAD